MLLTHTETVDLAVLASFDEAQIEGEPDFVVELIDLYLEQVPLLLDSIRIALETNNGLAAQRSAHSLRGSSSNLGVLQIAIIADQLEHVDVNYEAFAQELLQSLESEFECVKEILIAERQRRS
jgi:HPt (histidine-containing phosphotransfer) domain-containing protein